MPPLSRAERQARARREYAVRVDRVMDSVGRLEDDAVREVLDILRDAREDIGERLAGATDFEMHRLAELQASTDQVLEEMRSRYQQTFEKRGLEFWEKGSRVALDPVEQTLNMTISSSGPTREILEVLQGTTADLVEDITTRARSGINREIRNAVIGVKRPAEAQRDIMRLLSTRKRDGVRGGIAAQSERIIGTEMNRIYTVAQFEEVKRLKDVVPDIKKQWIQVSPPNRRRASHRQVHEKIIPIGQKFKFTGRNGKKVSLMFPRDPAGPPEEVISCLCRLITHRDDWTIPPVPKGILDL